MFPDLYITSKTGKLRIWKCWVDDNKIFRTDGQVDGKLKDPSIREISGNTLRTPQEQALQEAEKYWIKQLDKGYRPAADDIEGNKIFNFVLDQKTANGGMNRGVKMFGESKIVTKTTNGAKNLSQRHYPMLAKSYLDQKNKVKFPCFIQPKLDGVRAVCYKNNDKIVLESRGGKDYVFLDHIRCELNEVFEKYPNLIIDGEFYFHDTSMKNVERFQLISKACKITRSEPFEDEQRVEFWIFDLWDTDLSFKQRNEKLENIIKNKKFLKLVETQTVNCHNEIEEGMNKFIQDDFEGLMVRNDAKYVSRNNYHCNDLLKYKRFQDEEWVIIGAEECAGTQKGAIKWICENDGKKVTAKQMGTVEHSKKLYRDYLKNPDNFIGKLINIRYNDVTKDNIPRFPRATAIREDLN